MCSRREIHRPADGYIDPPVSSKRRVPSGIMCPARTSPFYNHDIRGSGGAARPPRASFRPHREHWAGPTRYGPRRWGSYPFFICFLFTAELPPLALNLSTAAYAAFGICVDGFEVLRGS